MTILIIKLAELRSVANFYKNVFRTIITFQTMNTHFDELVKFIQD